jgi:aspartyl-tRNA(Asn)/glutamyl-tRNA(Gln) amidotransferase subunit B
MAYEVVIGLEVHAQLLTKSKMFCSCSTAFGAAPNTQTCQVCLGMPGVLPVINRKAVEFAIRTGLALNCTVVPHNRFARKNYFYPDLPKGYQISQYELPICEHGWLEIGQNGTSKRVSIRRAHLEEDAGKNLHEGIAGASHVDLNRAGTPLLEIVTEPDMRSPDEAVAYLKTLRDMLVYLEVCDGNMEEGSLRCEPNLSLRPAGSKELGTKVELKNINSFRFAKAAMEYEIKRQEKLLSEGGKVSQETRLWNPDKAETAPMRSKEEAHDYRYFPDPDLVPLHITTDIIENVRKTIPELPEAMRRRLKEEWALTDYDAEVLTADRQTAKNFMVASDKLVSAGESKRDFGPKLSHLITGELRGMQNLKKAGNLTTAGANIRTEVPASLFEVHVPQLIRLELKGVISTTASKNILETVLATGLSPEKIVEDKGLTQISDETTLGKMIDEVIEKNPGQLKEYRGGKEQLFGFFVGQVMKMSGGKANPAKVNELLRRKLKG